MANTTTIHVKTDKKTRDEAKKVAEAFGFSLTSLVNVLLKQVVKTKRLELSLEEHPTPHAIDMMKKSEEDVKAGRVISFTSLEEMKRYLQKEITDEKRSRR
jgi:addiction module RelB/DinJ family antitoxin